MDLTKEEDCT